MSYGDDIVYSEMRSFKLGPFSKDRLIMLEFFQLFAVRISFQNKHVQCPTFVKTVWGTNVNLKRGLIVYTHVWLYMDMFMEGSCL